MSDNRSMVYEHLMSKVKILQALNGTEAVKVMIWRYGLWLCEDAQPQLAILDA